MYRVHKECTERSLCSIFNIRYCLYIAYVRQCIFYFGITFQNANKTDDAHRLTVLRCTRNNILLDCHTKFFWNKNKNILQIKWFLYIYIYIYIFTYNIILSILILYPIYPFGILKMEKITIESISIFPLKSKDQNGRDASREAAERLDGKGVRAWSEYFDIFRILPFSFGAGVGSFGSGGRQWVAVGERWRWFCKVKKRGVKWAVPGRRIELAVARPVLVL